MISLNSSPNKPFFIEQEIQMKVAVLSILRQNFSHKVAFIETKCIKVISIDKWVKHYCLLEYKQFQNPRQIVQTRQQLSKQIPYACKQICTPLYQLWPLYEIWNSIDPEKCTLNHVPFKITTVQENLIISIR